MCITSTRPIDTSSADGLHILSLNVVMFALYAKYKNVSAWKTSFSIILINLIV